MFVLLVDMLFVFVVTVPARLSSCDNGTSPDPSNVAKPLATPFLRLARGTSELPSKGQRPFAAFFWLLIVVMSVMLVPVSYTHLTLPTKRIV